MLSEETRVVRAGAVAILEDAAGWEPIAHYLEAAAYDVRRAHDEAELDQLIASQPVDAVLLDIRAQHGDRFLYCEQLSRMHLASILVVGTSHEIADKVVALELGADDYIEAPCNPRELLARLRSVTRARAARRPQPATLKRLYRFGGWSLDVFSQEVRTPQGQSVQLSPSEFSLLRAFVCTSRRMLSRRELMTVVKCNPTRTKERAIDVLMSRLRKKLCDTERRLFRTVRKDGYILMAEVERAF